MYNGEPTSGWTSLPCFISPHHSLRGLVPKQASLPCPLCCVIVPCRRPWRLSFCAFAAGLRRLTPAWFRAQFRVRRTDQDHESPHRYRRIRLPRYECSGKVSRFNEEGGKNQTDHVHILRCFDPLSSSLTEFVKNEEIQFHIGAAGKHCLSLPDTFVPGTLMIEAENICEHRRQHAYTKAGGMDIDSKSSLYSLSVFSPFQKHLPPLLPATHLRLHVPPGNAEIRNSHLHHGLHQHHHLPAHHRVHIFSHVPSSTDPVAPQEIPS